MALTIRLKPGETLSFGPDTTVKVLENSRGNRVFLQIEAPRDVPIKRVLGAHQTPHVDDSCR